MLSSPVIDDSMVSIYRKQILLIALIPGDIIVLLQVRHWLLVKDKVAVELSQSATAPLYQFLKLLF